MTVGSQVKGCFSSIKSIEAGLSSIFTKTKNDESKQALDTTQKIITEIKDDLQKQVIKLAQEEPQYK